MHSPLLDQAHVKQWLIFCGKEFTVHMELVPQVGFWRYHNILSGEELPSACCIWYPEFPFQAVVSRNTSNSYQHTTSHLTLSSALDSMYMGK